MRRIFDWPMATKRFNRMISTKNEYSRNRVHDILSECGLPCSQSYITSLIKEKHITVDQRRYKFNSDEFNYIELERCHRTMRVNNANNDKVQEAMELLKSRGFIILRQF